MSPDPTVDLVRATVALFIIVDPIGLVPIFSNVTGNMPAPDRNKMYRVVIYTGASLLTIFALVGQELLALFGISLPSFEMARSEEHTSELQSLTNLVCRLLLEKKNQKSYINNNEPELRDAQSHVYT